jgi:hypothetical protein
MNRTEIGRVASGAGDRREEVKSWPRRHKASMQKFGGLPRRARNAAAIVVAVPVVTGTLGHTLAAPVAGGQRAVRGPVAYVVNGKMGTVTPIATATNTPDKPIEVGVNPSYIAITPNGATAYVVNERIKGSGVHGRPGTVTPIALATNTPGAPIKVGIAPTAIAVTPDGKTVYVLNGWSHTVTPIATATGTPGAPIRLASGPAAIAFVP